MPISRKSTKRVIANAISRAVLEAMGARTGHSYLAQHMIDPMSAQQGLGLRDRRYSDSEPSPAGGSGIIGIIGPGDVVNLTGVFLCDVTGLENPNERFAN